MEVPLRSSPLGLLRYHHHNLLLHIVLVFCFVSDVIWIGFTQFAIKTSLFSIFFYLASLSSFSVSAFCIFFFQEMAFIYWSNSPIQSTYVRTHAHLRRSNQINTYLSFAFAFIYYYYYYCHYACPIHPHKHSPNDTYSVRQTTEHNTYEAMSHVCVCACVRACDVRACERKIL